jgi:methionyl-tRNA formyltransferase
MNPKQSMTILFAGTPEFAVPSLLAVSARFPVAGVLTQAEAPQGRGRKPAASPVKRQALELGLPVFEPEKLDQEFIASVKKLGPRLLVVAAYGKIFKRPFLEIFPEGGINVHPSLLPRWRGPSPIQAAIAAGDASTGVTVQRLALKMDTGDILGQARHPIAETDTAASLAAALAELGAGLCALVVGEIAAGTVRGRPQDEAAATYCKLLGKTDGRLDFRESAPRLSRLIRAYNPRPLAHAFWNGKRIFFREGGVYPGRPNAPPAQPGTVLGMDKDYGILIHTGSGILFISVIQLEYKKALPFGDFLNGHKDFMGSIL